MTDDIYSDIIKLSYDDYVKKYSTDDFKGLNFDRLYRVVAEKFKESVMQGSTKTSFVHVARIHFDELKNNIDATNLKELFDARFTNFVGYEYIQQQLKSLNISEQQLVDAGFFNQQYITHYAIMADDSELFTQIYKHKNPADKLRSFKFTLGVLKHMLSNSVENQAVSYLLNDYFSGIDNARRVGNYIINNSDTNTEFKRAVDCAADNGVAILGLFQASVVNNNTDLCNYILSNITKHEILQCERTTIYHLICDASEELYSACKSHKSFQDIAKLYKHTKDIHGKQPEEYISHSKGEYRIDSTTNLGQDHMIQQIQNYNKILDRDNTYFTTKGYCNGLAFLKTLYKDDFFKCMAIIAKWDGTQQDLKKELPKDLFDSFVAYKDKDGKTDKAITVEDVFEDIINATTWFMQLTLSKDFDAKFVNMNPTQYSRKDQFRTVAKKDKRFDFFDINFRTSSFKSIDDVPNIKCYVELLSKYNYVNLELAVHNHITNIELKRDPDTGQVQYHYYDPSEHCHVPPFKTVDSLIEHIKGNLLIDTLIDSDDTFFRLYAHVPKDNDLKNFNYYDDASLPQNIQEYQNETSEFSPLQVAMITKSIGNIKTLLRTIPEINLDTEVIDNEYVLKVLLDSDNVEVFKILYGECDKAQKSTLTNNLLPSIGELPLGVTKLFLDDDSIKNEFKFYVEQILTRPLSNNDKKEYLQLFALKQPDMYQSQIDAVKNDSLYEKDIWILDDIVIKSDETTLLMSKSQQDKVEISEENKSKSKISSKQDSKDRPRSSS